jgi:nucleotide-binding universal stress UspA family protein
MPIQKKHILVPLDGSRLAEAVLPAVKALASRFPAHVTLLHIVEQHAPVTIHGERHLTNIADARQYLDSIAAGLRAAGMTVECHVHEEKELNVAQSIFEHERELDIDLVIMCTHGTGGLRGFLFGSNAQRTLQRGAQSILLVFPCDDGSAPRFDLRHILVPLDGNVVHEPALPSAISLAQAFASTLHLALVIPTLETLSGGRALSGMLLPTTMRALLDLSQQEAEEYLRRAAEQCRAAGVDVTTEVLRGDTVSVMLRLAERLRADLIVMASHGRVGLDARLAGSVAPRIAGRESFPLLLVRADALKDVDDTKASQ